MGVPATRDRPVDYDTPVRTLALSPAEAGHYIYVESRRGASRALSLSSRGPAEAGPYMESHHIALLPAQPPLAVSPEP